MAEKLEVGGTIKHEADKYTVEVSRGMKGGYGWIVKIRGDDTSKMLEELEKVDRQLREHYLKEAESGEDVHG